ncbi:ribonuclease P protein component [Antarcticimicrobium sediminis]|uniref:Ribonuclease P protein component n=1 Tax=Antarcticimicrobium sediminis TaxID=2546227 RepID=A0A4R5EVR2_9RHOB|nr:ribonuclease P protein component [Antarcticimicrobium sediminis]TDE39035.1 ribonuclease P protein component [Antarcticimicrobium sediminis]
MTTIPPEAPETNTGTTPPAVSSCPKGAKRSTLPILRKRAEFLAASRARRQATATMVVQARRRPPEDAASGIRVGFTCSKKVGNAVARNRAKRRLREAARAILPELGHDGWDYVLIGRRDTTAAAPFETLLGDLRYAVSKLHAPRKKPQP